MLCLGDWADAAIAADDELPFMLCLGEYGAGVLAIVGFKAVLVHISA